MVIPAIGLIGGTKGKPLPIPGITTEGFAMQEDNVMVEYNIPAVRRTSRFAKSIVEGREAVVNFVRTKQPHLEPDTGHCSRLFGHQQLDHVQAKVFGCSADFDAHNQGAALPAPDPRKLAEGPGAWRFAGGHVHIGYEANVPDFVAAALADLYLGLPAVALDKQGVRRTLYGSCGRYRPTSYGIEYRTLSNFWIWDEGLAYEIGNRAMSLGSVLEGDPGDLQRKFAEVPWNDVQTAINTEDEEKAADLISYLSQDLGFAGL
jgi:hypothetical protein